MAKNHIRTLIASIVILLGVILVVFLNGKNATQKMVESHSVWGISIAHADSKMESSELEPIVYVHCQDGHIWLGDMSLKHEDFHNKNPDLQVEYQSNNEIVIREMVDGKPSEQEGRFIVKDKTKDGFILVSEGYSEDPKQELHLRVFKY